VFDKVEITVRGGNGGDGAVSFRREKYVPFGGPDGGDGGEGGDVVILSDGGLASLLHFKGKRFYQATKGGNGKGKKQHGGNGKDLILGVPVGTIPLMMKEGGAGVVIADLDKPGQRVVVAGGGKGGWGNTRFVSSTNQAPRLAQKGEVGEEKSILLELRLIADVGIIGYPNVGKSTLLSKASAARPKIASYPFTTLEPVLGLVEVGPEGYVWAEIPGLIDDAHLGRGLGHDFLRHIMRTRVLIHLVDGTSASPLDDMVRVNSELSQFDPALAQKEQLVVVNKADLPEVRGRTAELTAAFRDAGTGVLFISAASGQGVDELKAESARVLGRRPTEPPVGREVPGAVFRPRPREAGVSVGRDGEVFIVTAPDLERIVDLVDVTSAEVRQQLRRQMAKRRIREALEEAGISPGDRVRLGSFEWEW